MVKDDAKVFINDINEKRLKSVANETGAEVIAAENVYTIDMDIYAPCALGATVNTDTLNKLKCSIICGSANNQLADENIHGKMVIEKDILYAPDFVVNAGGIINVYAEIAHYDKAEAMRRTENIYNTTLEIFAYAKEHKLTSQKAAMEIAEARIAQRKKEKANL